MTLHLGGTLGQGIFFLFIVFFFFQTTFFYVLAHGVYSRNFPKWDRCPLALKKLGHRTIGRGHFLKFTDNW